MAERGQRPASRTGIEAHAGRAPASRGRDVAGEDFLFHLYRGSELLQDNRVHDAKAELEQALSLQPSDPKGQDLLGIVYFRLGLYPRAIAIYEDLIRLHPDALEPRINLALSYLKTGQAAQARFELEKVVERSPGHSRAWGYLGLAFQRLGDFERATYAFQTGGHDGMARRLLETSGAGSLSLRPEPPSPAKAEVRRAAGDALAEVDREGGFRRDEERAAADVSIPRAPATPTGPWQVIEVGRDDLGLEPASLPRPPARRPDGPVSFPSLAATGRPPEDADASAPTASSPIATSAPASLRPAFTAPARPSEVAREALLVFPRDLPVASHASGLVLVQATAGFAARFEVVRSVASTADPKRSVVQRRARGRVLEEPLGGPASPLVEIAGKVEIVLGPSAGQRLLPMTLTDEALYLREDALAAFETSVAYENGRLPTGDGDSMPMVQLRGPGAVVASVPLDVTALEVIDGKTTSVRTAAVIGWTGRLVPRGLVPGEAHFGARGFVAFTGEGMVLVDGR